ncbi:sugar transferase [Singulisphaera sp. PoT]|uniref:sugar transferase n=1 Tax=Singulisphaera sp. PoT TaxID=3411797 RepID=UPI003BF48FEA
MKRGIDFVGAGIGLVVISPLMLVIAVMTRLDSKGPVFSRQTRMGRDGLPFEVWMFRTMVQDGDLRLEEAQNLDEATAPASASVDRDPRITRWGRVLRRTGLDELPQLFNVLLGQMSLVGPRALPLRDCSMLREVDDAAVERRHEMTPGLTGLWQVDSRGGVGSRQMIDMDYHYVDNWSLKLDLDILLRTFKGAMGGRKNA